MKLYFLFHFASFSESLLNVRAFAKTFMVICFLLELTEFVAITLNLKVVALLVSTFPVISPFSVSSSPFGSESGSSSFHVIGDEPSASRK